MFGFGKTDPPSFEVKLLGDSLFIPHSDSTVPISITKLHAFDVSGKQLILWIIDYEKIKKRKFKYATLRAPLEIYGNIIDKLSQYAFRLISDAESKPLFQTPLNLKKKEYAIFEVSRAVVLKEKTHRSRAYMGASMRISKGLRIGGVIPVEQRKVAIVPEDVGEMVVTNQRVVFVGQRKTYSLNLSKIVKSFLRPDSLIISVSNRQQNLVFTGVPGALIVTLITLLNEKVKEG